MSPESIFETLLKDVEAHGFVDTITRRLGDFAEAHSSRAVDLHGDDLAALIAHDSELGHHIDEIESGSSPRRPSGTRSTRAARASSGLSQAEVGLSGVTERDGTPVRVYTDLEFQNWGRTVKNVPSVTAFPRSKIGICNLVKWAAKNDKRVRVAGYRHTWGDLYAADGEVLISTLPLELVNELPAQEPAIDPENELQGIEIVGKITEDGRDKALCRIGCATTNEQFRRWCLNAEGGALQWTVPLNVIMVEITWGGSNAPICHGAGIRNRTLSDLVMSIEFVNAKGEIQVVDDPEDLKAASGALGLMGVVTSVTLKLDPMTYAKMTPTKRPVALAIPPPQSFAVPDDVDMSGITRGKLEAAFEDFTDRARSAYYAEWFWFAFESECWINTWANDGSRADSRDYPGDSAYSQEVEEYLAGLVTSSRAFNCLPETTQARILAKSAMLLMPSSETIVTPLIDALHFRRGIQNMRVLDMEWEIPIPEREDDPNQPDWSICQQAWWSAIDEVYKWKAAGKAPMRLTLEMRVMGGSDVTLAPQHGNDFGTCSIEVLTTTNTDRAEWTAFKQAVTDRWLSITDRQGRVLNTRPHWAKEWQGLEVRGAPINHYLRDTAYAARITEFGAALKRIAEAGDCTMYDLERRFANASLSEVIGAVYS